MLAPNNFQYMPHPVHCLIPRILILGLLDSNKSPLMLTVDLLRVSQANYCCWSPLRAPLWEDSNLNYVCQKTPYLLAIIISLKWVGESHALEISQAGYFPSLCHPILWTCWLISQLAVRLSLQNVSCCDMCPIILFRLDTSHLILRPTVYLPWRKTQGVPLCKQKLAHWVLDVITLAYRFRGLI